MSSNFNPRSLTSPGTRLGPKTGRKLSNVDFVIAFVKKNGPTSSTQLRQELMKFTGSTKSAYNEYFYTPSKSAMKITRSRTYPGIGKYWTRSADGTVKLTSKGTARATEIFKNSKTRSNRTTTRETSRSSPRRTVKRVSRTSRSTRKSR